MQRHTAKESYITVDNVDDRGYIYIYTYIKLTTINTRT